MVLEIRIKQRKCHTQTHTPKITPETTVKSEKMEKIQREKGEMIASRGRLPR